MSDSLVAGLIALNIVLWFSVLKDAYDDRKLAREESLIQLLRRTLPPSPYVTRAIVEDKWDKDRYRVTATYEEPGSDKLYKYESIRLKLQDAIKVMFSEDILMQLGLPRVEQLDEGTKAKRNMETT